MQYLKLWCSVHTCTYMYKLLSIIIIMSFLNKAINVHFSVLLFSCRMLRCGMMPWELLKNICLTKLVYCIVCYYYSIVLYSLMSFKEKWLQGVESTDTLHYNNYSLLLYHSLFYFFHSSSLSGTIKIFFPKQRHGRTVESIVELLVLIYYWQCRTVIIRTY